MRHGDRIVLAEPLACENEEFKRDFSNGTGRTLHEGEFVVVSTYETRVRLADAWPGGWSSKWFHEVSVEEARKLEPFVQGNVYEGVSP